jgi:signal transduction histidine kinase
MSERSQVTVLTVDDNDVVRYSLGRMLLDAGYHVVEAKNGCEALVLAAASPDLITLDVNLPDMDGFQVCRQLKSNPLTRHIPVLHVSGTFVDPEYRVQGLKGGADAYLAEPIDRAELVATVEALLRMKRFEKEARQHAELAESVGAQARQLNVQLEARVKQRAAELEVKSEEIRKLNGRLMKLQDEERRKIARELHDSTGQFLALLNINLSRLSKMSNIDSICAKELIAQSATITSDLTSHLRTVSYLLHPPLLDELGLPHALEWYVEGFAQRSHIAVKLEVPNQFGRLQEDLEIAIFRIVQECLTNIHRHSGSQCASVHLRREPRLITLEVKDTGTKFEKGITGFVPGTGILGMRERVRQHGGDLNVYFEATGTCVQAIIPLA